MTTNEDVILTGSTFVDRIRVVARRLGARMAFSELTPMLVSLLGVLFILSLSGAVLLTQRLEELAGQSAQTIGLPASVPMVQQRPLEFTLSPDEVMPISEDEARAFNAGLPFSTLPILAAKPFIIPADRLEDYTRAVDCLAAAVYYEAASETTEGQAAVAQVVLNRVRHPAYPSTVCGVVFQGSERPTGCQFSFTCDGAMNRVPSIEGWARAKAVASSALNGSVAAGVGMATHYHTDYVAPYWAERLVKMRQIGAHIFYRWAGTWGLPGAFTVRHGDVEPTIAQMAALSAPLEALDLTAELPLPSEPIAPIILRAPPPAIVVVEPHEEHAAAVHAAAPAPVAAPPAPPPGPTIMASPLTPPQAGQPERRRSRIATPF
ncbi:hypothetical protein QOZ96_002405 [Brevundimonas nasdae]|jgi:Cell Wall Hydrolase|uniref:cell wall hydrolase n=1 Tax=Brevundimonas nasdae TaxID=172043 RepID=UPI0019121492|nr:cell wall hydrolase [Brevundimonas nasdae]MBK6025700.1 cell wall hydrolase [Brevundimonas nasdae]MDQ0452452.1 hypothetical protein [Brevundimonas nasdae]